MDKERYIGESKLKDEVRKKLVLKIKEGSITPEHLSNEVVDEVIQPLIDDVKEDLQEQIDSVISEGMSPEDKEKLDNLPTPAEFEALEAKVDAIDLSGYATTEAVNAKYTKPSGGIPLADLADTVQTSLGLANSALQSHQDISGKLDKPSGGTIGQVLTKTAEGVAWDDASSGGVSDYDDLTDKPSINNVPLSGNKSASDLGLVGASDGVYIGEAYGQGDNPEASFNAFSDTVWNKAQTLSSAQKTQARTNIGAQESLVSGTNIKTINNESLLGSGNISISGGGGGVTDVTVGGTSVVSNGTAVVPAIPTVPTISTDISTDASSDTKTASPKAVKTYADSVAGDANVIEAIKINGTSQTITSKYVDLPVPTSTDVHSIVKMTEAAYAQITPDANTLYILTSL